MTPIDKRNLILDALEALLDEKKLQNISVSEIAERAGISKGSIYYYYPSKDAILNALIERSYKAPLETAKQLAGQTDVPPFTRMAMLFQSCRSVSSSFIRDNRTMESATVQEKVFIHHKYANYMIKELKPELTAIIRQGIALNEIHFDDPESLAEIVLIILITKLDNTLLPSTDKEIENTLKGMIGLLEKGTGIPAGTLQYLSIQS